MRYSSVIVSLPVSTISHFLWDFKIYFNYFLLFHLHNSSYVACAHAPIAEHIPLSFFHFALFTWSPDLLNKQTNLLLFITVNVSHAKLLSLSVWAPSVPPSILTNSLIPNLLDESIKSSFAIVLRHSALAVASVPFSHCACLCHCQSSSFFKMIVLTCLFPSVFPFCVVFFIIF